jgi:hypothetical protein
MVKGGGSEVRIEGLEWDGVNNFKPSDFPHNSLEDILYTSNSYIHET